MRRGPTAADAVYKCREMAVTGISTAETGSRILLLKKVIQVMNSRKKSMSQPVMP
jgi:uncharacterized membrane protein (UPF0136 family)